MGKDAAEFAKKSKRPSAKQTEKNVERYRADVTISNIHEKNFQDNQNSFLDGIQLFLFLENVSRVSDKSEKPDGDDHKHHKSHN